MERTITINGAAVPMKATASTLRRYRAQYGRDLLEDFPQIQAAMAAGGAQNGKALDMVSDLAFIMAKQADPQGVPGDPLEWLDSFDVWNVADFAADVVYLWAESQGFISEAEGEAKNG